LIRLESLMIYNDAVWLIVKRSLGRTNLTNSSTISVCILHSVDLPPCCHSNI
jgi:hypothetical protein